MVNSIHHLKNNFWNIDKRRYAASKAAMIWQIRDLRDWGCLKVEKPVIAFTARKEAELQADQKRWDAEINEMIAE